MSTEAFGSLVTSWTTPPLFKRSSQSLGDIFRVSKLEYDWPLVIWKKNAWLITENVSKGTFSWASLKFLQVAASKQVTRKGKRHLSSFISVPSKQTQTPTCWAPRAYQGYLANALPGKVVSKNVCVAFSCWILSLPWTWATWKVCIKYLSGRHRSEVPPRLAW